MSTDFNTSVSNLAQLAQQIGQAQAVRDTAQDSLDKAEQTLSDLQEQFSKATSDYQLLLSGTSKTQRLGGPGVVQPPAQDSTPNNATQPLDPGVGQSVSSNAPTKQG